MNYARILVIEELLEVAEAAMTDNFAALKTEAQDLRMALQAAVTPAVYEQLAQSPVTNHRGVSQLASAIAFRVFVEGFHSGTFEGLGALLSALSALAPDAGYDEEKKRRMRNMERRSEELWRNRKKSVLLPYLDVLHELLLPRRAPSTTKLHIIQAAHLVCKCLRFTPEHVHYESSNRERLMAALAKLDNVVVP